MIQTTLCYIEQNNKYLMLLRNKKKNDPNEGKWIGVGGKLERNETPDECLYREVKEETGLTLHSHSFTGVITFISDKWEAEQMYLYTSTEFTGDLNECNEGELRWIDKADILKLDLWQGDRIFLKLLLDGEKHFNLKLEYQGEKLVNSIIIRQLVFEEYEKAFELVMKVFMQYEAPDYTDEGIEAFKSTGIEDPEYVAGLDIYGAFVEDRVIGVIAARSCRTHLALYFVDGEYHRQGIGRQLFEFLCSETDEAEINVNSSPYAREVYHHLGFMDTDVEQTVMGLRFTPMIYKRI